MVPNQTFDEMRKRLVDERASLTSQIDALEIENQNQQDDYGAGNHLADDASELFTRERNIALRNNTQDLIAQIDTALHRITTGDYGRCENCRKPINPERLEALPSATLCIECQSEAERSR